jgi:hypothetical protein
MHDQLAMLRAAYAKHQEAGGPDVDENRAIENLAAELVAEIEAEIEER